jgi:hypothetical protein
MMTGFIHTDDSLWATSSGNSRSPARPQHGLVLWLAEEAPSRPTINSLDSCAPPMSELKL